MLLERYCSLAEGKTGPKQSQELKNIYLKKNTEIIQIK